MYLRLTILFTTKFFRIRAFRNRSIQATTDLRAFFSCPSLCDSHEKRKHFPFLMTMFMPSFFLISSVCSLFMELLSFAWLKVHNCCQLRKILKPKADFNVNRKQDLFEFDFELHLSDGLLKQKKLLHWTNTHVPFIFTTWKNAMLWKRYVRWTRNILA